jgi:hypothetical protein
MPLYLGKDGKCMTAKMTETHATVAELTTEKENLGYNLCKDKFFSFPDLCDNLHTKAINCCGTVRRNQKEISSDFEKNLNLKWGDIKTRVKGDLATIVWKNK